MNIEDRRLNSGMPQHLKTVSQLVMAFVLGCFGTLLLAGCDRAKSDWDKAVKLNTSEAYQEYVIKYPSTDRLVRSRGTFTGHSIMVGEDGRLKTGLFGNEPPEFEIRSESDPGFLFKMSVGDAGDAGFYRDGRLELAATYTYTDAEMVVLPLSKSAALGYKLVYFKCGQLTSIHDDGQVKSSSAKTLTMLRPKP